MIRTVNIKGKEYYVITTFIQADGVEAPVQIHVSLSHLKESDRIKVQKHSNYFFNRVFKSITKQKHQVKKPWYKFW